MERARWSDFVEWFEQYDQPVMEQLFEDGTIVEWGLDASSLHRPDGYTHSTWFSATSFADLERVLDAFDEAMEASGDAGSRALVDFASMITKHRDYLLRDLVRRSSDAQLDGGYWKGSSLKTARPRRLRGARWYESLDGAPELLLELLLLGGAGQGREGGGAPRDGSGHLVEVPGPHLTLVLRRRVAVGLGGELHLL